MPKKLGKLIIPYGVRPEPHEYDTIDVFLKSGKNVEIIAPSRTKSSRTADILMDYVEWEMKCPMGDSKNTIFNALKRGAKQSHNIIIDLRYTKISDIRAEKDLRLSIGKVKSIKRVLIISKTRKIITIK